MSTSTVRPPAQRQPTDPSPAVRPVTHMPIRGASLTAGAALLLMSALAVFGNFFAVEGLVTEGNAARTAADITASEGTFRLGIGSLYLVIALDIVVAWALYRLFRPVSSSLSMLASWLRLAYAGVFMVAISELVGVVRLLGDDAHLAAFSPEQLQSQALLGVNSFTDVWQAGLLLFGLHLMVVGYLAFKSGYVPRVLGVLLAVAGLGYAFDSFVHVIAPDSLPAAASVVFVGEFLLAVWLVIRGRRLTVTDTVASNDSIAVVR